MKNLFYTSPKYLQNLKGIESSASEIDSVANIANPLLTPIHKLFREAANGVNTNVKYITAGDSTRSISYAYIPEYYVQQLTKIGVSHYSNAVPGQSIKDWLNNTDQNTLQQAIDNSSGVDGANTILEFSMGINDYDGVNTEQDIINLLRNAITAYKIAKPKASVILVRPNRTASTVRDGYLLNAYTTVAPELNLLLISAYDVISDYWRNPLFYYDDTHPNRFGARRIINKIFDTIIPSDLKNRFTLEEYNSQSNNFANFSLPAILREGKYWSTTNGTSTNDSGWYSLEEVAVTAGQILKLSHLGNRVNFVYVNASDAFVQVNNPVADNHTLTSTVPSTATKVRINISSQASSYKLLKDIPTFTLSTLTDTDIHIPNYILNNNLNLGFGKETKRNGILVDDYGKTGTSGQSLKIDSSLKMKWSI